MENFSSIQLTPTEPEMKFQSDIFNSVEPQDSVLINTTGTPVIQIRKDNIVFGPTPIPINHIIPQIPITIPNPAKSRKYVRKPKPAIATDTDKPIKPKRPYVRRNKKQPEPEIGALDLTTTGPNSSLIGDSHCSYSNSQIATPLQHNGIITASSPTKVTPPRKRGRSKAVLRNEMMNAAMKLSAFEPREFLVKHELPLNSVAIPSDDNKIITHKKVSPKKRKTSELLNTNHHTNHIDAENTEQSILQLQLPISIDNIKKEPPVCEDSSTVKKKPVPRKGRPKKSNSNIINVANDIVCQHSVQPLLPEIDIKQETLTPISNDLNTVTNIAASPKKKGRPKKSECSINNVIKMEICEISVLPPQIPFDATQETQTCNPQNMTKKKASPRKGRPKKSIDNINNLSNDGGYPPSLPLLPCDNEQISHTDDNKSIAKVKKRTRKSQDSQGNIHNLVNGEACQSSAELQFPFDSRESEIDDTCINLHFEDDLDPNDYDSPVFYSLTTETELNLMNVINNVAKGEGEITPYCVPIQRCPKRTLSLDRPFRRKKIVKKDLDVYRSVTDITENERVPSFQDHTNALISVPGDDCRLEENGFMKIDQPVLQQNFKNRSIVNAIHAGLNDVLPVKVDPEKSEFANCSLCKWNLRPTSESYENNDYPKLKTARFVYTPEEKHELYADGQFLVDQYDTSKSIREQILWRVVDSCRCLQRFNPYEASGRVFHHGTQHLHIFEEKDEEFYQRFQPIYVISIFEDKEFQIALYIFVERIHAFIVQISRTDDLFYSYKVVLQLMISGNLKANYIKEELCREGGDLYFSENWESINSAIENRANEISSAELWSEKTFHILSDFPRVTFPSIKTLKNTSEKTKCLSCQHPERQAIFHVKCSGAPYDSYTFEPLPAPEISNTPFAICYFCTPILRSFVRLKHYRFFMYFCVQRSITKLTSNFQDNEKCDPLELLKTLMSDHEWILKMFLDFQVILAEADKSISDLKRLNDKKIRGIKKARNKFNN